MAEGLSGARPRLTNFLRRGVRIATSTVADPTSSIAEQIVPDQEVIRRGKHFATAYFLELRS